MKLKALRGLLVTVLLLLALTACLPGKGIKGDDQEAVLTYVEPIADNILNGIEANDYVQFSQDFNDPVRAALTEDSFQQLRDLLSSKVGSYQSRQVSSVRDIDGTMLVIYVAEYTNAKQVVIQLSVTGSAPHQVSGLYFDAPEMRK